MKTIEQIRALSTSDLHLEVSRAEHNLVGVRMKIISAQEKDVSKKRKLKRYIARLKTILRERNIGFSTTK